MATVVFFEKPGCRNNTRQKQILTEAGHQVVARDLLQEPWTADRLRSFFGDRPVAEWFNRAAPRVKAGEVVPETVGAEAALAMMLAEPLLIRRPLLEVDGRRDVGFEADRLAALLGPLGDAGSEACPRSDGHSCASRLPAGQ